MHAATLTPRAQAHCRRAEHHPHQRRLGLGDHDESHAQRAGRLPGDHRDPFDRMLIAQAQLEDVPIVTNEAVFDAYRVNRIW